jgi:hypothetical protein
MEHDTRAPLLIFVHLPKTGGSTLARVLKDQYASDTVLSLYDSFSGAELQDVPRERLDGLRVVMGHFAFGAHRFVTRRATYVTVLRDPVDRVVSHYHFVRHSPGHYLHRTAQGLSLSDYVVACHEAEPNNDQTRLLCGEFQGVIPAICSAPMLAVAKDNLHRHFAVAGLTEDFDRSLMLMKRRLGWRHPFYAPQNVARGRVRTAELRPNERRLIERFNQFDLELYEYARAVFQEEVCREDASFERELRSFTRLNALFGRLRLRGR